MLTGAEIKYLDEEACSVVDKASANAKNESHRIEILMRIRRHADTRLAAMMDTVQ